MIYFTQSNFLFAAAEDGSTSENTDIQDGDVADMSSISKYKEKDKGNGEKRKEDKTKLVKHKKVGQPFILRKCYFNFQIRNAYHNK